MFGIIYLTINKINNKKYIGQHKCDNLEFDGYLGSGKSLNRAINKYGKENFNRITLDCANNEEELNFLEREYIKNFNAVKDRNFYNIHVGGLGGDTYTGKPKEEKIEFKRKMSEITSGENNGMFGKRHSEEAKKNMSKNHNAESNQTEEYREKMSKITSGKNNGMYGKHHNEESLKNMSEHSKGKNKGEKNGMHGKKGNEALNGVHYYCYDDDNTLVKEFVSFTEVKDWLNINHHSSLLLAIKKNRKYKGYYWKKDGRIKKV